MYMRLVLAFIWSNYVLGALCVIGCGVLLDPTGQREEIAASRFESGASSDDPAAPKFDTIVRYRTTIQTTGDAADIYFPYRTKRQKGKPLPIALLLQGANVEKSFYGRFAATVARYGFVVVVPNHRVVCRLFLLADLATIDEVLAFLIAENQDGSSPLSGLIDENTLVLIGHSFGGAAGLGGAEDVCGFPFCSGGFTRPAELSGVVVYGTDLVNPFTHAPIGPIKNDGLPIAVIRGELDGVASPADVAEMFDQIQDPPTSLITVLGANHFGITDVNNPPGTGADPNRPTLRQKVAAETIARWSALFLRGHALGDAEALEYVTSIGDGLDPNVSVTNRL